MLVCITHMLAHIFVYSNFLYNIMFLNCFSFICIVIFIYFLSSFFIKRFFSLNFNFWRRFKNCALFFRLISLTGLFAVCFGSYIRFHFLCVSFSTFAFSEADRLFLALFPSLSLLRVVVVCF